MKSSLLLLVAATLAALAAYSLHQQHLWVAEATSLGQRIAQTQAQAQALQQTPAPAASDAAGTGAQRTLEQALSRAQTDLQEVSKAHGLVLEQGPGSLPVPALPAGVKGRIVAVNFSFNSHQQLLAFVDDLTRAGQRVEQVRTQQQNATVALLVAGEAP